MKNIFLTLTIFASMLLPAMNAEAQIRTQIEDDVMWIVVDGTDNDDSVYVLETLGGTVIYLYRDGALVDSRYFSSDDLVLEDEPASIFTPAKSLGKTKKREIIVLANLYGGDDFYQNNSSYIDADLVSCGTGRDLVYAGPGESWVGCDFNDRGRKQIFGGGGDDWLVGGAGNDLIHGGDGNDIISGNDGHDALHGDAGDDQLYSGTGFNSMYGGTGEDQYHWPSDSNNYFYDPDQQGGGGLGGG